MSADDLDQKMLAKAKRARARVDEEIERKEITDPRVALARLAYFMEHCFKCEAEVSWDAGVCETCGCELLEHAKQ